MAHRKNKEQRSMIHEKLASGKVNRADGTWAQAPSHLDISSLLAAHKTRNVANRAKKAKSREARRRAENLAKVANTVTNSEKES